VESRNLFDPAVNLLEPPEWRRGPSREGRHGEFPLKVRQLHWEARKHWDEHFQGSLCGSVLRLVTHEEHSVNCFVADDVPGNQETAIGIIHQIGPLGA
jgi:hypothetical protein